jgi:peptidoglycan hydrolase CwlO-like protein
MFLIVFLIVVFIYLIVASIREGYENNSQNCKETTMNESIQENASNIAAIQTQITGILSNIQDLSGNLSSVQDEVNSLQGSQAQLVSGAQPANISGTD